MDRPFERVYTVHDFFDRPRAGFADFDGVPHAYRSIWREDLDDWDPEDRFELSPIEPETLALVLEDWEIWKRWEEAYHAGQTSVTTHPALPADRERHNQLAPAIERALKIDPTRRRVAIGEFRKGDGYRGGPGIRTTQATLEVRWTPVEASPSPAV